MASTAFDIPANPEVSQAVCHAQQSCCTTLIAVVPFYIHFPCGYTDLRRGIDRLSIVHTRFKLNTFRECYFCSEEEDMTELRACAGKGLISIDVYTTRERYAPVATK